MNEWKPKSFIPDTNAPAQWQPKSFIPTPEAPIRKLSEPSAGIVSRPLTAAEQETYETTEAQRRKEQWLQEEIVAGRIESVPSTFWQRTKKELPQVVGGIAGGIAGAATFGPDPSDLVTVPAAYKGAAKLAGAVLGAGLGGAAGKGLQQTYRMTRPGAKSMTLNEIYTEQAIAGIEEAAAELVGRGITKIGGKILAPLKKRLIKEVPIKKIAKELSKRGAILTPAQATESRIIDTLEGMAEKSFLGGGKLQRLKRYGQPAAFARYIDDVVEKIARGTRTQLSPEEVGNLLLDTISGKKAAFKATAKAAYNKVDVLAGEAKVSLGPLKKFAKITMKKATVRKGIGATQAGDTLLKKVIQLDDVIPFRQAQALRSALLDEKAAMSITRDKAIGLTKQFIQLTDDAMEQGAKELSPEALKAWRIANKFYKTGMTTFDKKIIKSLTKNLAENPEVAIRKIFRPGASKQIKVVKNLADKNTWNNLRTGYLEQLIKDTTQPDGAILGTGFLRRLNKMGEATLKEMFNGEELVAIRLVGQMGDIIQRPTGGSGGMLIQLMQAGAVVNLGRMAVGGADFLPAESAVVVIGPPVLSRLMVMPKFARWLSMGYTLPARSPEAMVLGIRIIKTVNKIRKDIVKEKQITKKEQEKLPPLRKRLNLAAAGKELFTGVFGEERY